MSSADDRAAADCPSRGGTVIWITGLSGAGKTALARQTYALLRSRVPNVVLLDGDLVRWVMDNDLGHDRADRLKNAYRIARLCKVLSDQDIHVVCATMSLFAECHEWNRRHITRYFEVYLRVPFAVLVRRDPKGLYSRVLRGDIRDVVGVDTPFSEPEHPNLVIDNAEDNIDLTAVAARIIERSCCLQRRNGSG